jgi:hypothetical protein
MSEIAQTTKAVSTEHPLKDPVQKKWLRLGIVIVIIITIITCLILIVFYPNIFRSSKNTSTSEITEPLDSVSDIQNAFAPPLNQPQFVPATTTNQTNLTSPVVNPLPTPTGPLFFNYKNQSLGFELKLEGSWQNAPASDSSITLVNEKNRTINIQAYQTSDNLSNVKIELLGSSSVNNLQEVTFKNFSALSFTANGQKSLATIVNSRLYYIFGSDLINENNFTFLTN